MSLALQPETWTVADLRRALDDWPEDARISRVDITARVGERTSNLRYSARSHAAMARVAAQLSQVSAPILEADAAARGGGA